MQNSESGKNNCFTSFIPVKNQKIFTALIKMQLLFM